MSATPVGEWVETVDSDGDVFYYNTETGESRWSKPGWVATVDSDGEEFFYNEATGEVAWEKPPSDDEEAGNIGANSASANDSTANEDASDNDTVEVEVVTTMSEDPAPMASSAPTPSTAPDADDVESTGSDNKGVASPCSEDNTLDSDVEVVSSASTRADGADDASTELDGANAAVHGPQPADVAATVNTMNAGTAAPTGIVLGTGMGRENSVATASSSGDEGAVDGGTASSGQGTQVSDEDGRGSGAAVLQTADTQPSAMPSVRTASTSDQPPAASPRPAALLESGRVTAALRRDFLDHDNLLDVPLLGGCTREESMKLSHQFVSFTVADGQQIFAPVRRAGELDTLCAVQCGGVLHPSPHLMRAVCPHCD